MTRTARSGNKMSTLPSTPWVQLKGGYQTLQEPCESPNQSDCEYNATTTTYEADADVSDPTLQVTKKEKLKTKKKKDKLTTRIEKSLTRKKLRKQLEELEMTPLLIDTSSSSNLDKTEDPSGDEVKIKKHKATRKSKDKQDRLNSKEKTIATSNLDKTEDLSEDEDTFKKYSSTKAARKSSDKQKRSKTKTRTTSSKIHSSSDEAVCLIQSDMDADNERTNSSSPVSEHTPSNEGGATLDVSEKKRKSKLKKSQTSKSKAQKSKWEALDEERRMKRNEARRLRRQKRKVCFNCRQSGHHVSECKMPLAEGTGMCFKCGGTDHTSKRCRARVAEGEYPYAKCFICGEVGHLSRACPENPKGLYPHGGSCKLCGSVEHFKANCPEKFKKQGGGFHASPLKLVMGSDSVDAENFDSQPLLPEPPSQSAKGGDRRSRKIKPHSKIVTF